MPDQMLIITFIIIYSVMIKARQQSILGHQ